MGWPPYFPQKEDHWQTICWENGLELSEEGPTKQLVNIAGWDNFEAAPPLMFRQRELFNILVS